MYKINKLLILCLIEIFFTLAFSDIMSEFKEQKKYNIFFKNSITTLEEKIYKYNKDIMVSANEISKFLDIDYNFYKNNEIITFFKNNIFIKMKLYDNIAYVNGNKININVSAKIKKDEIIIPLEFLLTSLDFDYNISSKNITISNRDTSKFYLINHQYYKTYKLPRYNIQMLLPYDYKIKEVNFFEVIKNYNYKKVKMIRLKNDKSPEYYANEYKQKYLSEKENFEKNKLAFEEEKAEKIDKKEEIIDIRNINIDDKKVSYFSYDIISDNNLNNLFYYIYIFQMNKEVYKIEVQSNSKKNIDDEIFEIIKSIKKNNTLITYDEHYYEYPIFYDLNFSFDKNIISNLESFGKLNIQGFCEKDFFVKVEKEGKNIIKSINIKDKHFNEFIYTPFGLGKHNITFYLKDKNIYKNILKFSIINISDKYNLFNISTDYINSDDKIIVDAVNEIVKDSKSDYERIRKIYDYILNEISLIKSNTKNKSIVTFENKKANSLEINLLFNAFIRARGFDSKIYYVQDTNDYFTEVKLNATWYVFDISSEIRKKNNLPLKNNKLLKYNSFFRLNTKNYKENFEKYQILY